MTESNAEQRIPVVLRLKKRKNKSSKRYTKGLGELQETERHLTRSTHRMVRAIEKGLSEYRKERAKSASKKKDGALRDFIPNSALAMSTTLKEASALPYDLARAIDTKKNRKRVKRQLRVISRTLR